MAQTFNSRDLSLQSVSVRTTNTTVTLSSTSSSFIKLDIDGSLTPASLTISSSLSANFTNPTYVWEYSTNLTPSTWITLGTTTGSLTITNTQFSGYISTASILNVRLTVTQTGLQTATAVQSLLYTKESDDVIQIVTAVEETVVNATSGGTPISLTNTGNTISVVRNGVYLAYGASGADTFSVGTPTQSPSGGVTLGTVSTSGNTYTISDITAITQDSVTVTYPITIRNSNGTARQVINKTHRYSRVKQGANGVGTDGNSYRIAYAKTTVVPSSTPTSATTSGNTSFPSIGTWGAGETWGNSVMTLSAGESMYQIDGIYSPGTGNTVWSAPYLSNLKVGNLSAVSANTGALLVTDTLTLGTSGVLKSSGTSYGGNGIFLGYDSTAYKFSVGTGTNKMTFDGTTLSVPATTITGQLVSSQLNVAIGGGNLVKNSSFEADVNSDGLPDDWSAYSNGTTGTITRSLTGNALHGTYALRIEASNLGTTTGDRAGVFQDVPVSNMAGQKFRFSFSALGVLGNAQARVYIDYLTSVGAYISSGSGVVATPTGSWARYVTPVETVPATAFVARVHLLMEARPGSAGSAEVRFDAAQFEFGELVTAYAPKADEILANSVTSTQIADLVASKITGSIVNSQIADLAATKITGTLVNSQIADLAAGKITGTLVNSQIADLAATKITGQLTSSQLNVVIGGGNFIKNSSFETTVGGTSATGIAYKWQLFTGGSGDPTRTHSASLDAAAPGVVGSYSQFVQITGGISNTSSDTGILSSDLIPVIGGTSYYVSGYVKPNVSGKLYILVRYYDSNGGYVTDYITSTAPANVWTRLSVPAPAPSNAATAHIGVRGITAVNESFFADGIQFEQADILSAYAPRPDEILPSTITSTEVATDAITAPKILAGAVVAGKIAANAVSATEIAANSVTAEKILAGAVTTAKLAAGSVTAEKLTVASFGDSVILNPGFEEASTTDSTLPSHWTRARAWGGTSTTAYRTTTGLIRSGTASLELFPGAGGVADVFADAVPVAEGEQWYVACSAIASGTNAGSSPGFYLRVRGGGTVENIDSELYLNIENLVVPTSWTKYEGVVTIPAGMKWARPFVLNYSTNTGVKINVDEVEFKKVTVSASIADGAVTANKIFAGAVTTAKLDAGAVTAAKISSGAVTTDKLDAAAVTAGKIAAGSITASKILLTGSSLFPEPYPTSNNIWSWDSGWSISTAPTYYPGVLGVPSGLLWSDPGRVGRSHAYGAFSTNLAIVPGKQYTARWRWVRSGDCSDTFRVAVYYFDSARNVITADYSTFMNTATGASSGLLDFTPPANTAYYALLVFNELTTTAWAGWFFISDFRINEKASSELIVDGAVIASKIYAGAVTADKIDTGAVTAAKISAGAITTEKLLVTGRGDALNDDPNTQDVGAWNGTGFSIVSGGGLDTPVGTSVLRCSGNSTVLSRSVAVDPNKNYQFRIWIRQASGSSTTYLTVAFADVNGTNLSPSDGTATALGWPSYGGYYYFGVTGTTPPAGWTEYRISFGPGETAGIPANAKTIRVGILANYSGSGVQDITGVRLMLKADADLIVDGAITANKIFTGAVTAAKLDAGAVTTAKLDAGAVTADKIFTGAVTTAKLDAGAVTADKIFTGAVTTAKLDAGAVTADKIQAGSITTSKLLVTGQGSALNDDPALSDPSAWENIGFTFTTITDGVSGVKAARSGATTCSVMSRGFAINASKTYRIRAKVNPRTGNGVMYLVVNLMDSSGNTISRDGTFWYYPVAGTAPTAGWNEYTGIFGAGQGGNAFPSNARTMAVGIYLNYNGTSGYMDVQDLRIEEMASADMIVDGAITANKLTTNFVYTKAININNNAVIDSSGNATFKSVTVADNAGNTILQSGSTVANSTINLPGTINNTPGGWLNSNIAVSTSTGAITGIGTGDGQSVANNTDSVIRAPVGGVFVTQSSVVTGALKIRLPQGFTDTMMRFTVEIYEYVTGYMCTIEVGGYNYSGNSTWINTSARVIGGSNVEYPVYFGHDGTKCCVWIGAYNETWAYPQARVRDFFAGYNSYAASQWATGWTLSFDTTQITGGNAANQYSASVLDTYPSADWSKTARRPSNLASLSGTEAIQNSQISISGGNISGIGTGDGTTVANSNIAVHTSTGAITGIGTGNGESVANNMNSRIMSPGGGIFTSGSSSIAGALRIRLPALLNSTYTMVTFTVDIYEYITGYSTTMSISGHTSGTGWYEVTAQLVSGNIEYPVYFGHDGTYFVVWIGNASETWSYPQVFVSNVLVGYSSVQASLWASNWNISFDTTGAINVTRTVADTYPAADWSKTARKPSNLAALSGTEAIQNSQISISGGNITGIGTGNNTSVANNLISVTAAGVLQGAGGGQVFATAGINLRDSNNRTIADDKLLGNLLDITTWVPGSSGSQPGFNAIGTSSGGADYIAYDTLPDGSKGTHWRARSGSAAGTGGEGGWNSTYFNIDSTKMYRFSVWIRCFGANTSGSFYLGVGSSTVNDIGGGVNNNPYFISGARNTLPDSQWVLLVGYVFPSNYSGSQENKGGAWRASDGVKIFNAIDYRWVVGQTNSYHRSYQYYTTQANNYQDFFDPRVEMVTGSEPSLDQLLAGGKAYAASLTSAWTGVTGRPSNLASLSGSELIRNSDVGLTSSGGTISLVNAGSSTISGVILPANPITSSNVNTYLSNNAVITSKLFVTGRGKALNDDPQCQDLSAWTNPQNNTQIISTIGDTGVTSGTTAIRATNQSQVYSREFAVQPGKTYKVTCLLKQTAGTGYVYIRMYCYNTSGGLVSYNLYNMSGTLGAYEGITIPGSWTRYTGYISPGAGSVYGYLFMHVNWGIGNSSSITDMTDMRVEEYIGADLVVDGAITAQKINITDPNTTGRVSVSTNKIQVYDNSNQLRVTIGYLL